MKNLSILIAFTACLVQLASSAVHVEINVHDSSETCSRECILYNEQYKGEYLYGGMTISSFLRRNVYTWSPQLANLFKDGERYTFTDDDKKGVWYFEPASCDNNEFYLKNKEYNEYLYATSFHYTWINDRRKIYTMSRELSELDDSFKWRIDVVDGDKESYMLTNVKYGEPLYAASYFFRKDALRRSVFSWNKRADSEQFHWHVKCRDGYKLIE